jgi:hypothetical protein
MSSASPFPTNDELREAFLRPDVGPVVVNGIIGRGWVFESELALLRPHYNAWRPEQFADLCFRFASHDPEDALVLGTTFQCPRLGFAYALYDANRLSRAELLAELIAADLLSSAAR